MQHSCKVCGGSEAAAVLLLLCNCGVFFSSPSSSLELSTIKLEHFGEVLSCLCLTTSEWTPIVLVLSSEVVLAGECW